MIALICVMMLLVTFLFWNGSSSLILVYLYCKMCSVGGFTSEGRAPGRLMVMMMIVTSTAAPTLLGQNKRLLSLREKRARVGGSAEGKGEQAAQHNTRRRRLNPCEERRARAFEKPQPIISSSFTSLDFCTSIQAGATVCCVWDFHWPASSLRLSAARSCSGL